MTPISNYAKITTHVLQEMKLKGEKIAMLTAYDYSMARIVDETGIDVILVGDSASNVMAGHSTTLPITLNEMIYHASSVVRAVNRSLVIVDLPFGTYQGNSKEALNSAIRIMKESGASAVKLEGGHEILESIERILSAGIPVMGHLGLTPQSSNALGGFKAQGLTADTAIDVIEDARLVYEAGAFSILIEGVPPEVTRVIRDEIPVPIYSIGAGAHADGQLMIISDIVGHFQAFTPKFVKRYGDVAGEIRKSVASYISEVKNSQFPTKEHSYRMKPGEWEKLEKMIK